MKVAIVTPFHGESVEVLAQNMRSVYDQVHTKRHTIEQVIVADGDDPGRAVEAMDVARLPTRAFPYLISLPVAHRDWGDCARAVGALDAVARGCDAIAFLDGDNWFAALHVSTMIELHESRGVPICTAGRMICRVDGSQMFPDLESDGEAHVDANCLFVTREAFYLLPIWAFVPLSHAAAGDRVFWQIVKSAPGIAYAHSSAPTVNYRSRYAVHYRKLGEPPPPEAKENPPHPRGIVLQPRTLLLPLVGEQPAFLNPHGDRFLR
jgi:hypothetical protein